MSGRIGQPVGQVRLTNVAIIRMKKNGKRFEIAAYKNKVVNWRSGVEKDLNEVLQTTTVFTNVSKGVFANKKDLEEAFGTDDYEKAAVFILNHGEIEIGEKERQAMFEAVFRDVATIIAEKCVNPDTQRPYTLSLIEKALKDAHFAVVPSKSAKQQALKAVQVLQTSGFQIERARMRVRLTVPIEAATDVQGYLKSVHAEIESTAGASAPSTEASGAAAPEPPLWTTSAGGALAVFDAIVDPGCYRGLEERVGRLGAGSGAALEVLSLAATAASGGAGSERRRAAAGAGGGDADSEEDEEAEADGPLPASSTRAERHKGAESDPEDEESSKGGAKHASAAAHKPAAAATPVAAAPAPAAAAPTRAAHSSDETAAAARGTGMLVSRVTQPGARLSCATCSATFDGPEGHRAHFRSDFHRYNLKRKMRAQPGIPEEAFKALTPKEVAAMLEALE